MCDAISQKKLEEYDRRKRDLEFTSMQEGEWMMGGAGQKVKDGIRHMGGTMMRMSKKPKELATQIMTGQGRHGAYGSR